MPSTVIVFVEINCKTIMSLMNVIKNRTERYGLMLGIHALTINNLGIFWIIIVNSCTVARGLELNDTEGMYGKLF